MGRREGGGRFWGNDEDETDGSIGGGRGGSVGMVGIKRMGALRVEGRETCTSPSPFSLSCGTTIYLHARYTSYVFSRYFGGGGKREGTAPNTT